MASTPSEAKRFQSASVRAGSANTRKPSEWAAPRRPRRYPAAAAPPARRSLTRRRRCERSRRSPSPGTAARSIARQTEHRSNLSPGEPSEFFLLMIVTGNPVTAWICAGSTIADPKYPTHAEFPAPSAPPDRARPARTNRKSPAQPSWPCVLGHHGRD